MDDEPDQQAPNGADERSAPPDAEAMEAERQALARAEAVRARVRAYLETLPVRQRQILEYRFGFVGGQPHTLQETGDFFGVSRQRVHQIIAACRDVLP